MICPNCRVQAPESAVICEHCNTVLDLSIAGLDLPPEDLDGEATNPRASNPLQKASAPAGAVKAASPERSKLPAQVPAAGGGGAAAPGAASAGVLTDQVASAEVIDDLFAEIRSFAPSERLTLIGAALTALALGLPWRVRASEPMEIGLVSGGWPLFLTGAVALVVVVPFLRRREWALPFRNLLLQVSLISSLVALLSSLIFIKINDVSRVNELGQVFAEVAPSVGVFLALLGTALCVGGSLLALLRRNSLPG